MNGMPKMKYVPKNQRKEVNVIRKDQNQNKFPNHNQNTISSNNQEKKKKKELKSYEFDEKPPMKLEDTLQIKEMTLCTIGYGDL